MLAVRCLFLQGTYAAAAPGRQAEPEWPPHPARLHAALVAAAWASADRNQLDAPSQRALEWLELTPPSIAGGSGVGYRGSSLPNQGLPPTFVPRNLSPRESAQVTRELKKGNEVSRLTGRTARVFPTAVPGDASIWFVWSDDPPPEVRRETDRLLAEVQYLGSSRSPVCTHIDETPPAPWLVPVPDQPGRSVYSARVAVPGTTGHLVANRFERLRGAFGVPVPYGSPAGTEETQAVSEGAFERLLVLRITAGTRLDAARTWRVARAFRAAVLSRAGDRAPPALHGHGPLPHCAFLPLPAVGHPETGGRITGMGLAIPRNLPEGQIAAIEKAALEVSTLRIRGLPRAWTLAPIGSAPPLQSLLPTTWCGPSRRWCSVTPVALDRHPKRSRGEGPARLLAESVRNAIQSEENGRAPEISRAAVLRTSAVAGAPSRGTFGHVPDVGYLCDAEVVFDQPLRGPLVVGRRRHFGVGLFLPVTDFAEPA